MEEFRAMKIYWMLLFSGLCVLSPAESQQRSVPDPLVSALGAPDWSQREAAYENLKGNSDALKRADVRRELVALLGRENQIRHQTLSDSKGRVGIDDKYGEEYS